MPDYVVVVGPSGPETHTVANARDLVLHVAGYSYGTGKPSPVDSAVYAEPPQAGGDVKAAQSVLDRYGAGPGTVIPPVEKPTTFEPPAVKAALEATKVAPAPVEPVAETAPPAAEPDVVAAVEPESAPEAEAAPVTTGRQPRAPKAKA